MNNVGDVIGQPLNFFVNSIDSRSSVLLPLTPHIIHNEGHFEIKKYHPLSGGWCRSLEEVCAHTRRAERGQMLMVW